MSNKSHSNTNLEKADVEQDQNEKADATDQETPEAEAIVENTEISQNDNRADPPEEQTSPMNVDTIGKRIINNCMALLPVSSKTNMIPIAVLRKPSTYSVEESGGSAGLMQIIAGTNKVAPVINNPEQTVATVNAAVLMLVPKKSDSVCIEIPSEYDQENNPVGAENQANANCSRSHGSVRAVPSYDSYEEVCRICHDNPSKLELISPCLCRGSMSKVHRTCLERWLGESAKNSCEICGYQYNTVRKLKYTGCSSVCQWIRHPLSPSDTRNLFFDIACFFILTPLAAISSWLCVVGAQHYNFGDEKQRRIRYHDSWSRNDFRADKSNATWTSVGLLSLTGTLLVAYSVWLFVAIKYHIQAWRDWQQRNFTVTIVPYEDGCMERPPAPRERNEYSRFVHE